jgi:co-chaperonin GroES (HSP10)
MINVVGYGAEQIKPRHDCVLVRPERPAERQLEGGLVAPAEALRPIDGCWATVLAVAEPLESFRRNCSKCERPLEPYADEISVGDRVLMENQHCGDAVMVEGAECRIVRVAELLAVESAEG